jgi:hypothetical protein
MTVWGRFRFPILDRNTFNEFLDELDRRRVRNSRKHPQANDTLITEGHPSFEFLSDPCYRVSPQPATSEPKPPAYITRSVRQRHVELDRLPSVGTEITLIHIIKPCLPWDQVWKSQVWRARVSGREVIAKIYQACFPPEQRPSRGSDLSLFKFYPEEEEAHREAWAFHQLFCLQGTIIPHSYGFFTVRSYQSRRRWHADAFLSQIKLPSQDMAIVHIMEYIEGKTLGSHVEDFSEDEVEDEVKDGVSQRPLIPLPAECISMHQYVSDSVHPFHNSYFY